MLKQLGPEVKTNSYYSSMKTILERSASVLIDVDVIQVSQTCLFRNHLLS